MTELATDVAGDITNTPATDVADMNNNPSKDDVDSSTVKPLPGEVDPHGKRGGLSRTEKRLLELEKVHRDTLSHKTFDESFSSHGEDVRESLKAVYDQEVNSLVELGVNVSQAIEKARLITLAQLDTIKSEAEEKKRTRERAGATLPPQSNIIPEKLVYTESELVSMPMADAVAIRTKAMYPDSKIRIV